MGEAARKWIIKDAEGRILGPFTTEKILYKIGRGEFDGQEFVALHPSGDWIPISQDPQFYDRLLESLSENEEQLPDESSFGEHVEPKTEIHQETPGRPKIQIDMEAGP